MTEPTDKEQYLNIADQCTATATSELAASILVDGGNGTLRQLLNDAADAIRAGWATPPTQAQAGAVPLTDEMASKAGRALSDLYATECGIDKEDNWKVYGSDFIETAKLVLAAAHGIKGGQHGAE